MITIDGAQGEGGGQIVRTALGLSVVTGKPFTIHNIRAKRPKPGLMRQHLTAVQAAAAVGQARVTGAALRSTSFTFEPAALHGGEHHFAVGTAGSTTLVLQTVLPALFCAAGPSTLRLEGGTHNPWAPPFDFLVKSFLPLVNRMGPRVTATLVRPGFYPAGGGELRVTIAPAAQADSSPAPRAAAGTNPARGGAQPDDAADPPATTAGSAAPSGRAALRPIELLERGAVQRVRAIATIAHLPRSIAERELRTVAGKLGVAADNLIVDEIAGPRGPGNLVTIEVESEHVTEVFTGFGKRGLPAEIVADHAVQQARRYLSQDAPVGEYLTDQLLIPLALAGGGAFRTLGLSPHAQTNIAVIQKFLDVRFEVAGDGGQGCTVRVRQAGGE